MMKCKFYSEYIEGLGHDVCMYVRKKCGRDFLEHCNYYNEENCVCFEPLEDEKEQQIEEMAVIGCVRNPQAHTAEECAKCDFKNGQCNSYRHAEDLYNAGYRKLPEDSVVLSKEEYDNLKLELQKAHNKGVQAGFDMTKFREQSISKQAVKAFAEKLKEKALSHCKIINCYELTFIEETINELLKEYEK